MATRIRKTDDSVTDLAEAINDLKAWMVAQVRTIKADLELAEPGTAFVSTTADVGFHNDKSEVTVTAAAAADLATSLELANQIKAVYSAHCADTLAHKAADTTNVVSAAEATDLATAIALANEIKADYNAHRASTTFHEVADTTNVVAAVNATDQATLNTLLNEIKGDLNAHMGSGPAAKSIRAISA